VKQICRSSQVSKSWFNAIALNNFVLKIIISKKDVNALKQLLHGNHKIVNILATDIDNGRTALHYCSIEALKDIGEKEKLEKKITEIMHLLVNSGTPLYQADSFGKTALEMLSKTEIDGIIKIS